MDRIGIRNAQNAGRHTTDFFYKDSKGLIFCKAFSKNCVLCKVHVSVSTENNDCHNSVPKSDVTTRFLALRPTIQSVTVTTGPSRNTKPAPGCWFLFHHREPRHPVIGVTQFYPQPTGKHILVAKST